MLPPAESSAWDYRAAAHLLHRAGFGATPQEIEAFQKLGLHAAIAALFVPPPPVPDPEITRPETLAASYTELRGASEADRKNLVRQLRRQNFADTAAIREWWVTRMTRPEAAALEKMTLFWHGHFATSVQKVKSASLMWQQNQLLRKFAFGNVRDLVKAISCDPAMVIWLDLQESRDGAPNENFARELMELFTLGIGQYSEDDIKASARAFTGYRARPLRGGFAYLQRQHDDAEKTFLGKTGRFSGDDIIDIIFTQPACARFLCEKLWTFYAYEDPEPVVVASLAATFRKADYEIRPVLAEMFGSKAFYSEKAVGTQIKSPAQLIAQTSRTLECSPPGVLGLQPLLRSLGQLLLAPPNVKGWDGNRSWINTATLASRVQFSDAVAGVGERARLGKNDLPLEKIVTDEMINHSTKLIDGLTHRLLCVDLDAAARTELIAATELLPKPLSRSDVREILARIMREPEFQLV